MEESKNRDVVMQYFSKKISENSFFFGRLDFQKEIFFLWKLYQNYLSKTLVWHWKIKQLYWPL